MGSRPHVLLVGSTVPAERKHLYDSAQKAFDFLPVASSLKSKRVLTLFQKEGRKGPEVGIVLIDLVSLQKESPMKDVLNSVRLFLGQIRKMHSTACVILIGPPMAVKNISSLLRNGVYDYLTPPISPASLVKTCTQGLKNREQAETLMSSLERSNRELLAEKDYFQRWTENLSRIYKINQSLVGSLNVDDLVCSFGESVKELLAYETLSLFLKGYEESEPGRAWIWARAQPDQKEERKAFLKDLHDETVRLGNMFILSEEGFSETMIQEKGAQMIAPLFVSGEKVGLLRITRELGKNQDLPFDDYQARLLSMVTTPLCLTLHNARMYQRINALAATDELTHVLNRRAFLHIFEREFKRAVRLQTPLALLLIDLDLFKGVNDRFGHLVGDTTLKEVSALLKKAIREIDILGRYGGEEFVVILTDGQRADAMMVAERIRHLMETSLFNKENDPVRLTVSIGVASLASSAAKNAEELFHMADIALYNAKRNGRNRMECAPYEVVGPKAIP